MRRMGHCAFCRAHTACDDDHAPGQLRCRWCGSDYVDVACDSCGVINDSAELTIVDDELVWCTTCLTSCIICGAGPSHVDAAGRHHRQVLCAGVCRPCLSRVVWDHSAAGGEGWFSCEPLSTADTQPSLEETP